MSVSMQVSMKKSGTHERKLSVSIPFERVDEEVKNRLKRIAQNKQIPGFRKGKASLDVLDKRFGEQARMDAVDMLIQSSLREAIEQEKLVPAERPKVDIQKNEKGQSLEFEAVFEVYPEVTLKGTDKIKIQKPGHEVTDADVTDMLSKISRQFMEWKEVKHKAKKDDRLTLKLKGTLVGEEEPFTEVEDMAVEMGAGRMIPGFEENLVGLSLDEEKSFEVEFPEKYFDDKVAGKPARFDVKVLKIESGKLPELDDALAEKFGMKEGGIQKLKDTIKENMEKEAAQLVRQRMKEELVEYLLKSNKVDIPPSLLQAEVNMLKQNPQQAESKDGESLEDVAERRVKLSLLLGQFIKDESIQLDHDKVREVIQQMAANYPDPQAVMKWFYSDQQRLSGVVSMVLEDQAVDKLLEGVQESDQKLSYKELTEKGS